MTKKDDIIKSLQDKVVDYITKELTNKKFNINTNQSYDNHLSDYVNFLTKHILSTKNGMLLKIQVCIVQVMSKKDLTY